MMLGGRHHVFYLIGLAHVLGKRLPLAAAEGASAGGIASIFAIKDVHCDVVRDAVRQFDVASLIAPLPGAAVPRGLDRFLGRSDGSVFTDRLTTVLDSVGVKTWRDLRREDETCSMQVRVSAIRLRGRSFEQARKIQENGNLFREVVNQLRCKSGLDVSRIETWKFPDDVEKVGIAREDFDRMPVAPWLVRSASHPVAFKPLIVPDPSSNEAIVLTDGALPWDMRASRRQVPESPTALIRIGANPMTAINRRGDRENDLGSYPGFFVLRTYPVIDAKRSTAAIRFDLDDKTRVSQFDKGVEDATRFDLDSAFPEYLDRHNQLQASGGPVEVSERPVDVADPVTQRRYDVVALAKALHVIGPIARFSSLGKSDPAGVELGRTIAG